MTAIAYTHYVVLVHLKRNANKTEHATVSEIGINAYVYQITKFRLTVSKRHDIKPFFNFALTALDSTLTN